MSTVLRGETGFLFNPTELPFVPLPAGWKWVNYGGQFLHLDDADGKSWLYQERGNLPGCVPRITGSVVNRYAFKEWRAL